MDGKFYAHSREGQPAEEGQPLEEHLREVARRASEFAAPFSSADWACKAGWLHDLRKDEGEFQKRVASDGREGEKQPHAHHGAGMNTTGELGDFEYVV